MTDEDARYQAEGIAIFARAGKTYRASDYVWTPTPPDAQCGLCYEWRRYPEGQRHFGFAWWRICDSMSCSCAHHTDETWTATC